MFRKQIPMQLLFLGDCSHDTINSHRTKQLRDLEELKPIYLGLYSAMLTHSLSNSTDLVESGIKPNA